MEIFTQESPNIYLLYIPFLKNVYQSSTGTSRTNENSVNRYLYRCFAIEIWKTTHAKYINLRDQSSEFIYKMKITHTRKKLGINNFFYLVK
jgi:hypothetical protein